MTAEPTVGARTRPIASLLRWHLLRLVGVTLLLALPGLTTAALARAQSIQYDETIAPARDSIVRLHGDLTDSLAAYHAFLTSGDERRIEDFRRAHERFGVELSTQEKGAYLSPTRLRDLRSAEADWHQAAQRVIADVAAHRTAIAAPATAAYERAVERARGAIDDTANARNEWSRVHDRTLTIGIFASLAAALVAAIAGWGVMRSAQRALAAPLHRLASVVRAYDAGDWSERAPTHHGATEIVAVASALNRLAESETAARAEQELSLRILAATSTVVSELAIAPSQDGHWSPACEHLGVALGADRVVLNTWDGGRFFPLGSWFAPDTPPQDFFLHDVRGQVAERLLIETRIAGTPAEIVERFPPELAAVVADHGGRAWILQPLRVADGVVGVLSVWCLSDRRWHRAELEMVERCAFAAAQTVADARQLASLHDLEEQKSAFLATTSHELRTPLTSISGYVELLSEGEFGDVDPEQAHALAVVERNVRRLRALVDDLLILSGLDSGRAITTHEKVPIDAVARDALADVHDAALAAGVRLEYGGLSHDEPSPGQSSHGQPTHGPIVPGLALVEGVHDQLVRALRSILGNAVKFSRPGGVVQVGLALDGGHVVVTCRDDGIGIPAEEVDKVFSRFYRATNAAREEVQGTGLGLAITKSVVEGHGGDVRVSSVEGGGTTVTVRLPLASAAGSLTV